MAGRRGTASLGEMGEHLVAAELKRRGFRVQRLGPRAHDWDIIAEKRETKYEIQVKTIGSGSWQCGSATKYIKINLIHEKQSVVGKQPLKNPNGIYIFVSLEKGTTFYLTTAKEVQNLVYSGYIANLKRHRYRRPRNPYTFHHGCSMADLSPWKNNWRIFSSRANNAMKARHA